MTTTIDAETETGAALTVMPATAISTIIAADKDDILGKFAAELKNFKPDGSTEKGREAIGTMKRKAGVARQNLLRLATTLREGADKTIKGIRAEVKIIDERFDELIERIEAPRLAYLQIEKDRVAGHEAALAQIEALADIEPDWSLEKIAAANDMLADIDQSGREWQEFSQRAEDAIARVAAVIRRAYDAAQRREAEAAELARLRAEQAERDRLAAIEAQRIREEQIAHEAAETARREAEAKAAREADAATLAALRAQNEAAAAMVAAERRAEQERETARQVAERAEASRVAAHEGVLADMRKLATPLAPPDPAVVIDSKLAQLDDVYARDWEEFKPQADMAYITHQATLQDARVESVRLAEELERKKQADAEAAAAKRQAAAIEAERARVAEAKRADEAEAAKRAENRAHQGKINGEVLADILTAMEAVKTLLAGCADEPAAAIAKAIITAIAKGQIRHTKIGY